MLKKISIRTRLTLLLAALCGLLIVTGFVGIRNAQSSLEALNKIYNRNVVRLRQLKIISDMYAVNIVDAAHKARNGNVSPSEAAQHIETAMSSIGRQWQEFSTGTHTPEEDQLILELTPLMGAADQSALDLRSMLVEENMEEVTVFILDRLYPTIDPITGKISNLIDTQLQLATSEHEAAVARYAAARTGAIWIIAAALLIAVWFGWTIIRSISVSLRRVNAQLQNLASGAGDLGARLSVDRDDEVGELTQNFNALMDQLAALMQRIQNSGLEVHSASAELAASAKQLQAVVSQQVAATNQVAATANHISATSEELVETVTQVSGMSHDTAEFAGHGRETVARMETAMKQMEEAVRSISGRLDIINDKASRIGTVITTIGKIADQTNVLSFNAAIEAEKAGEFGQGFAVVAREIRRLADQTDVATNDIERMVREMGSAVAAGVMSMDKFTQEVGSAAEEIRSLSSQLSLIIERVGALQSHFDSVNDGMQSQSESAHQIHAAITDLSQGAEGTAQSLRESNQAIQQLHHLAQQLHEEVGRFKLSRSSPQ